MPKYIANEYLLHNGKIIQTGDDVELTKDQADHLGDKVSAKTEAGKTKNVDVVQEK
ncbi:MULTISPECIES: DUF7210 family protein [Peribacillus]|uniref:DUF7210 family protein n=1 Tax=Peribacillus TaxID=2675229 RepID=UPI001F4DA429|nr:MULTISPECIES: hypothetical protein [unclassified Peribacillus]MCK1982226.1 hypothetical protein [Peribacillus sp. Aquil_B1]MCK2007422.1 hypothetical protein [Peribacillus sp. Aquil_B8]